MKGLEALEKMTDQYGTKEKEGVINENLIQNAWKILRNIVFLKWFGKRSS